MMRGVKKATLLLFDLDGTLLHAGEAGRRALAGAMGEVCGAPHAIDTIDLRGMTDLAIFRAALTEIGREPEPSVLAELAQSYLGLLSGEIRRARGYRVLPGVKSLLVDLERVDGVVLGLGTGNLEMGARIKLDHGALSSHFVFGGFGSDHETRSEVLRIGVERGAARVGLDPSACRVIVIGDTPRDVSAGLAIGAEVVGVSTGGYAPQTLLASGASWAFDDLSDPGVLRCLTESGSKT
jgi:phosphoglycolate phosphatase-like HAD superfamily hydrolase